MHWHELIKVYEQREMEQITAFSSNSRIMGKPKSNLGSQQEHIADERRTLTLPSELHLA